MNRLAALLLILAAVPFAAEASTMRAGSALTISESPQGNSYLAASELRVVAPIQGDLAALSGTLQSTAPVEGDVLALAGSLDISGPVTGDVRVAGGRVYVGGDVGGELAVLAGHVTVTGQIKDLQAAGGTVELLSGAEGPVVIYASSAYLSGEYDANVRIIASDQITLKEGTVIHGSFEYNAPQEATIPEGVVIDGGVHYIGSTSFLPSAEEARTVALAGLGLFFLVHLVAVMLAAGLLTGLCTEFARRLTDELIGKSPRRFLLLMLVGLGVLAATPILILLLLISFVGIGIAVLLGVLYVLALMLGYLFAGAVVGAAFARIVLKRPGVSWRSAAFGMLLLSLITFIPVLGHLAEGILILASLGALVTLAFRFIFGRTEA